MSTAAMMPANTDTGVGANHFCLLIILLTHLSLISHAKAKRHVLGKNRGQQKHGGL